MYSVQGGVHRQDCLPQYLSSMEVELLGLQGKNYALVITGLFLPIIPEQCSAKVCVEYCVHIMWNFW